MQNESESENAACPDCGRELGKGTRFCPNCGARQPDRESATGQTDQVAHTQAPPADWKGAVSSLSSCCFSVAALLLIIGLLISTYPSTNSSSTSTSQQTTSEQDVGKIAHRNLAVTNSNAVIDGGYIYVRGKVKNTTQNPVTYVRVVVKFYAKQHDTSAIDTDWTYAVSEPALQPGDSKSFEIMHSIETLPNKYYYGLSVE